MAISPKRILLIYYNRNDPNNTRLTTTQHLRALDASDTKHEIIYYNAFDDYASSDLGEEPLQPPPCARASDFEAVILHYSFLAFHWHELALLRWKRLFSWIGDMNCLKVAIPQDEYDRAGLLDEWLFDWDVAVVLSCFDEERRGPLYPFTRTTAQFHHCLTGYIDDQTAQQYAKRLLPPNERPFDIVYRARHLPFWFGSAGQLKHRLGEIVAPRAQAMGLRCDVSTRDEDAILGTCWLDFMASSRAVIGCESGLSVVDWYGEVEARVRAILRAEPTLSFEEVSLRMPPGWDSQRFFAISPRHLEAVITKTCQILVEGDYSGVLKPDRHYIPLKRDFSNLNEVLAKLRDSALVEEIVECAYNDIYLSGRYSYRAFAHQIEQAFFDQLRDDGQEPILIMQEKEKNQITDKTLLILERQLNSERHNNILLEAKLLESRNHFEGLQVQIHRRADELQSQINFLQEQTHIRADALQEQIHALQEQTKVQAIDLDILKSLLTVKRKKLILFLTVIVFGSTIISNILLILIMGLLRLL